MKKNDIFDRSRTEGGVMVEFYSDTCRPCKIMEPIMDSVASASGDIDILRLEVNEYPALTKDFDIRSIPAFIMIKDGKEVARRHGVCSEAEIKEFIAESGETGTRTRGNF